MKTIRFLLAALAASPSIALAQFAPGQPLSAAALNAAIAHPTITGGSIDGAPIGAATPSSARFTTLTVNSSTSFLGPINAGNGLVGAPSLYFGDSLTGFYRPALNQIGITANGTNVFTFSGTGLVSLTDSAIFGTTAVDSGTKLLVRGTAQAIRIGTSAGSAGVEAVDNTGSASYQPLKINGSTVDIGIAGTSRIGIAAGGAVTIPVSVTTPLVTSAAATDLSLAVNGSAIQWVITSADGRLRPAVDNTIGLGGQSNRISFVTTPILDSGSTGSLSLRLNNGETILDLIRPAGAAVNRWTMQGGVSGSGGVALFPTGGDATISPTFYSRGATGISFATNVGTPSNQFTVLDTPSATRNITVTGSNGGNPTISTTGGALAITPPLVLAGTGITVPATGFTIGDSAVAGSLYFDNAASGRTIITGKDHIRLDITAGVEKARINSGGSLAFTTAATRIIPGATSLSLRNNADNADNLVCTDAGNCTIRGTASAAAGGTLAATVDVQTFTTSGTWTKPTGAKTVQVIVVGGGGSGGGGDGGAAASGRGGGGGGGGGATAHGTFNAADVGATETITVGAATTGGAGGSSAVGTAGAAGNNSSFGTKLIGYGGGNGSGGQVAAAASGGGGGGTSSAGSGSLPGFPGSSGASSSGGGGGAGSVGSGPTNFGFGSEYGGSGGGGSTAAQVGTQAGRSVYGGGGGGAGGGVTTANVETNGGVGGGSGGGGSNGGGGTAGVASGGAGGAGAAGAAIVMGAGGGGGAGNAAATGGVGGAGGAPGGAGGGGGGGTTTGGAGGAGARGEVRVYTYF